MSHPAGKVLALLGLLQAHHSLTGPELARRLGVDERTVRRYADTLTRLGVPVRATRGRYGGYRLGPGYRLPPLMLTEDEGVAVVLGLLAAERLSLATERHAGAAALAKIQRVLPTRLAERVTALEESLGFTLRPPRAAAGAATPVLLALGEAVTGRHRVRLTYRNWRGAASERDLDPYGVVFHGGRWYVTGHDHMRGQVRTFRLDRIAAVETRTELFTPPDGFDAAEHVTAGLANVPYRWPCTVVIEAPPDAVRPAIPGTLTAVDGATRLDVRAENLDGMARMLAGLPWPFTVIEPAELRDAVAAHAARLAGYATRAARPIG